MAGAAIDAANGITDPTDPRSWTPAASPVARNMNQVREFLEPEERDRQADIFLASFNWLTDDRDPLNVLDPFQRVDLRFAIAPTDGNWEAALYGRDMTNDVGLKIGGGGRTFQSRTRAPNYDGGGISYERGARYGIQFGYFMGN